MNKRIILGCVAGVLWLGLACSPSEGSKAPAGHPDLTSNLQVEPGKEFFFGGGFNGKYTIDATNEGSVPIMLASQPAGSSGQRREIVTLAPGAKAVHEFADGELAIVTNSSATVDAKAKLLVWGKTDVGMGYRDSK